MKRLAGLDVTTKSVERGPESIGADIAQREQEEIDRAVQLDLPIVLGEPIPILYIQMDGPVYPWRKGRPQAARASSTACLPIPAKPNSAACSHKTKWDTEGFAIRDPDSTSYIGAIETAEQFGRRLYRSRTPRGPQFRSRASHAAVTLPRFLRC